MDDVQSVVMSDEVQKRWSPDGKNLRCGCGKWVDQLYATVNDPQPRCLKCLQKKAVGA